LTAATCALLGASVAAKAETLVDTAALGYKESGRVSALETVIEGAKEFANGQTLRLRVVYDALTGASANGALPAQRVQTFTRPSGHGSYLVQPGDTPLDDTFHDTRFAGSASWTVPLDRVTRATLGANGSTEFDYLSLALSGGIERDFALRNTTLSAGFSIARDRVSPSGGIPVPLSPMPPATGGEGDDDKIARALEDDEGGGGGGETKTVLDLLFGISQVLDRATLARLNYSIGRTTGYQTDPYKLVSIVQAPGSAQPGDPIEILFESRPDTRTKQSLFGEVRRMIGRDVALGSYRYFWDDWRVRSHTVDLRYTKPVSERNYVKPHARYYRQSAADFYRRYLLESQPLPDFVSADYRLGEFTATTFGLEVGRRLGSDVVVRAGVEHMLQRGDSSPPGVFGALVGQDLFPDVSAWMIRLGASVPVSW
jgi:hypothetical protein